MISIKRRLQHCLAPLIILLSCALPALADGGCRANGALPEPSFAPVWSLKSDSARIDIYGSIHLLPSDIEALSLDALAAYHRADLIILEADIDPAKVGTAILSMMLKAYYPPKHPGLSNQLGQKNFQHLIELLGPSAPKPARLNRTKPWMAAFQLEAATIQQSGMDPLHGVEYEVIAMAKRDRIPMKFLETASYQMGLFADMPDDMALAALKHSLEQGLTMDKMLEQIDDLIDAWQQGDQKRLAAIVSDEQQMTTDIAERLLYQRNRNWVPIVEKLLQGDQNILLIVGAAHLAGDKSLLAELEKRGHHIEKHQEGLTAESI